MLRLRKDGHAVSCNFHLSDRAPEDRFVDTQPYQHHPHLRVQVADAVTTSFGLTIRKAG